MKKPLPAVTKRQTKPTHPTTLPDDQLKMVSAGTGVIPTKP